MFRRCQRLPICLIALSLLAAGCIVTPEPIKNSSHMERSRQDLDKLRSAEFVPNQPIELHEAIARAIAHNLRYRIAEIELDIADAELRKANYDMLPTFDVNAARDRNDTAVSRTDDRITNTANATLAWNILDLGVSYARAHQKADEVLITREQERKAVQDIIRQVNAAFWRAAAGQRLLDKVRKISRDLEVAVKASRDMERTGATDAVSAVAFRREIVQSVKQALAVRRELREAKTELAELLNIRPGTDFDLALPTSKAVLPRMPMSVENLEIFALENRPELRVEKYNERIGDWQAREALYNLLPGLKFSVGQNYSSNSTNLSTNWVSTGVNMGMNLFKLFSGSSDVVIGENKAELARRQRLALSMAVLTQVHMARTRFGSAAQQVLLAHEIAQSDRKLTQLVRGDGQFFNNDFLQTVRLATRQLQSEMEEQRSYIDLVTAHADLMHAVGLDVVPETVPLNDIAALGDAIRAMLAQWNISDGTAEEPQANLPLDKLVNSMISVKTRADFTVAAAAPDPAERARRRQAEQTLADTLFVSEKALDTEAMAILPEAPEAMDQDTPDPPLPDEPDKKTDAGDSATFPAASEDAESGGEEATQDVAAQTAEQIERIAPAAGDGSSDIAHDDRPAAAPAPPADPKQADKAPARNPPTPERTHTLVRATPADAGTETARTAAPGPNRNSAPGPEARPHGNGQVGPAESLAETPDANGWEFATPSPPPPSPPAPRRTRKAVAVASSTPPRKERPAAGTNSLFSPRTIERLNRIAPSSRGAPKASSRDTMGWEFTSPPPAAGRPSAAGERYLVQFGPIRDEAKVTEIFRQLTTGPMAPVDRTEFESLYKIDREGRPFYLVRTRTAQDRAAAVLLCLSLGPGGERCEIIGARGGSEPIVGRLRASPPGDTAIPAAS